jgi:hypothetical protein
MSRIIDDFLESGRCRAGCGFWQFNMEAVGYAMTASVSQRRKWRLYKIVPAALFRYLEDSGAIPKAYVAGELRTVGYLLDLLWETPRRNRSRPSFGENLRKELLLELMPELKRSMASAEHMYRRRG